MQDIWDNVRGRAGDLLDDVSSGVGRQRQLRELEKKEHELEQQRQNTLIEIGEFVAVLISKELFSHSSLKEAHARLIQLEDQLDEIANLKKRAAPPRAPRQEKPCSSCGAPLPFAGAFCSQCGALAQEETEKKPYCGQCGAEMVPGAVFCSGCGARLVAKQQRRSPAPMAPAPEPQQEVVQYTERLPAQEVTPPDEVPVKDGYCVHCGGSLEADDVFCNECGWVVEHEDIVEAGPAEAIVSPATEDSGLEKPPTAEAIREDVGEESTVEENDERPQNAKSTVETNGAEIDLVDESEDAGTTSQDSDADLVAPSVATPPETDGEDPFDATKLLAEQESPSAPAKPQELSASVPQSCAACGAPIRVGAPYCPGCGAPQEQPLAEASARLHCGVELGPDMRFCPTCGEEVPFAAAVQDKQCTNCDTNLRTGARFCPACGHPAA